MPKKIAYTGAHVKVSVENPRWGQISRDDWYAAANHLVADIKRHCDDVSDCDVELEVEESCEFCGCDWTEDDKPYNGGCCDEDVKAADPLGLPTGMGYTKKV